MDTTNLAYIVKVIAFLPIPGKDLIEVAVINGWKCIVKKGEFSVGDLAVYLAIGSVPDFEDANFAFLKQKHKHNRIKTIKMGGVVSQGLLGPLTWLQARGMKDVSEVKEGDDVAELMGVTKYIGPEESEQYETYPPHDKNKPRQLFPSYVHKTDATRLQHAPDFFLGVIADKDIVITRKEDGCSATYIFKDGQFTVCGRNFIWEEPDSSNAHYFHIVTKFNLAEKMAALGRNLAVQGEICGPKISANRRKIPSVTISVFDVYDLDAQRYLGHEAMYVVCDALGLPTVPLLYHGPAAGALPSLTVDAFMTMSEATEYAPKIPAEGIVVNTDPDEETGARIKFKVISNKYLLKYDL